MLLSRRALLVGTLCLAVNDAVFAADVADSDFLIVGAGAAGLSAACIAAELGVRRITVLESEPVVGGTSLIGNGFWAVAGTEYQRLRKVQDSGEAFLKDMLAIGQGVNDPVLVKAFIVANAKQYEWVLSHGIFPKDLVSAESVRRVHEFDTVALMAMLVSQAHSHGVEILTGAKVKEILWNKEHTRINGVMGTRFGRSFEIRAEKAVLLATGGFSRNADMVAQSSPRMRHAVPVAAEGARGDGIRMALDQGAQLIDTQFIKASYGFIRNPSTMADLSLVEYSGAIAVNRDCHRFTDESRPYKQISDAALVQPRSETYLVFDERIREAAMQQAPDSSLLAKDARGDFPAHLYAGKSIREVARKAGLSAEALEQTVSRYNSFVKEGEDSDFGRRFASTGKPLLKIEKAPFFIMPAVSGLIGTYCGVRIDAHARVLGKNGVAIPGLYAAGEMTGGIHGASFMMGTALGKALAFGRIAAESVAGDQP